MNGERELWNPKFLREREGFDVKSGEDKLEICWVVQLIILHYFSKIKC